MKFTGLSFGAPKEIMRGERRVAVAPETVRKLVQGGAKVFVEKGAGEGSFFRDEEYLEAGAEILNAPADVYASAGIILKVKEPRFNGELGVHETDMMHGGQILVAFLHPAAPANRETLRDIAAKGINSLTLDSLPRIARAHRMDPLISMSMVAGYKSVISAADRLTKFLPMLGTAAGMMRPAHVVVIGAGVAGLQAVTTAKRLGAVVTAADIRPEACERARALGARAINPDQAQGEAAGAALGEIVKTADILILSAALPGKSAPLLVTEKMVASMARGSVIVDLSIVQGGSCELTEPETVCVKHGVTIDGTRNMPGALSASATFMFAHNVYNLIEYICAEGGKVNLDRDDEIIGAILTTINGKIVHPGYTE